MLRTTMTMNIRPVSFVLYLCMLIYAVSTKAWADVAAWQMSPVTSYQARVQADAPVWLANEKRFTSKFGLSTALDSDEPPMPHEKLFDSVNLASIEGALMYVQAEGIPHHVTKHQCRRKSDMQYIVFYQVTVAQSRRAMSHFRHHFPLEYGPFVALDVGKCTPERASQLPKDCLKFFGGEGQVNVGLYAGAGDRSHDGRAPYPFNFWFSYPGECIMEARGRKSDECKKRYPTRTCPWGVQPDGQTCHWSYEIIGYLDLDELTGVSNLIDSRTQAPYTSYHAFCTDRNGTFEGIEYLPSENKVLPFWEDGKNATRNALRAKELVAKYHDVVARDARMKAIPSVDELNRKNPPCYLNVERCVHYAHGCRRNLYAQLCRPCEREKHVDCVKAPSDYVFPNLHHHEAANSSNRSDRA